MLITKIIAVYSKNHTKRNITECQSEWFIQLPLGLKGLYDISAELESQLNDDVRSDIMLTFTRPEGYSEGLLPSKTEYFQWLHKPFVLPLF
jgi:hypothetical protein